MGRKTTILLLAAVLTLFCNCQGSKSETPSEDKGAKALLQGIWVEEESDDVSLRVEGDTIFYADSTSMPSYFRIIGDSLVMGSGTSYAIVKQTQNLFWFKNQNGDVVKFQRSNDPIDEAEFVHDTPQIMTYTHQVQTDSVVFYEGERYHWYIAINPTKYKVIKRSYNDDGMEVENVYYDNIMHVSVFNGARRVFSSDFRKQMYAELVPEAFLNEAILVNMEYSRVDAQGLYFNATLCVPDGASCYLVETRVSYNGEMTMQVMEN
jgi:hypothetical protein